MTTIQQTGLCEHAFCKIKVSKEDDFSSRSSKTTPQELGYGNCVEKENLSSQMKDLTRNEAPNSEIRAFSHNAKRRKEETREVSVSLLGRWRWS